MQQKSVKREFKVWLQYPKEISRVVTVKATTREVAEHRALKHNPGAIGVKRV